MTATIALAGPNVRATAVVVAAVGALAACGGVLAVAGLMAGEQPYLARQAPAGGAWNAPTSFGTVSVERVERFAGVPGGTAHAGDKPGSDRIRVALRLSNDRGRTVPFSPGQLRLAFGRRGSGIPPTRPNPPPGSIAGGQSLGQRLEFVVPASRASFALLFADIGRPRAPRIALGSLPGSKGR